jgi:hypothetical protein
VKGLEASTCVGFTYMEATTTSARSLNRALDVRLWGAQACERYAVPCRMYQRNVALMQIPLKCS